MCGHGKFRASFRNCFEGIRKNLVGVYRLSKFSIRFLWKPGFFPPLPNPIHSHNFSVIFQHDHRLLLHSRQPAVPCRIADSQGSGSGNEPKTAGSPSGRALETGIRQGEIRPWFGRRPWFFNCITCTVWLKWNYMKNICTAKSLKNKNVSFFFLKTCNYYFILKYFSTITVGRNAKFYF